MSRGAGGVQSSDSSAQSRDAGEFQNCDEGGVSAYENRKSNRPALLI